MTDWITWNGGNCPVEPETVVEVVLRDNTNFGGPAATFDWDHNHDYLEPGDCITAYRVVKNFPRPELLPREEYYRKTAQHLGLDEAEKPFSTRITEAEDKALEAVESLLALIPNPKEPRDGFEAAKGRLLTAWFEVKAAAALARDDARQKA